MKQNAFGNFSQNFLRLRWQWAMLGAATALTLFCFASSWRGFAKTQIGLVAAPFGMANRPYLAAQLAQGTLTRSENNGERILRLHNTQFQARQLGDAEAIFKSAPDSPAMLAIAARAYMRYLEAGKYAEKPFPQGVDRLLELLDRGRKHDPQNVYFHWMKFVAISQLVAQEERMHEALEALEQAAQAGRWQSYKEEEWKMAETALRQAQGEVSAFWRVSLYDKIVLSSNPWSDKTIKYMSRELLTRTEKQKDYALSMALRSRFMRVALRQIASQYTIERLQGRTICYAALNGLPLESYETGKENGNSWRNLVKSYAKFLRGKGMTDEAAWWQKVSEDSRIDIGDRIHDTHWQQGAILFLLWAGEMLLLCGASLLALLGGGAGVWLYMRRFALGETRHSEGGIAFGVLAGILGTSAFAAMPIAPAEGLSIHGVALRSLAIASFVVAAGGWFLFPKQRFWNALLGSAAITWGVFSICYQQAMGIGLFVSDVWGYYAPTPESGGEMTRFLSVIVRSLMGGLAALPLVLAIGGVFWALFRKVSVADSIALCMARVATPLCAVLLFGYIACALRIGQLEAFLNAYINRLLL